jgi:hypothetical protein
LLGSLDIFAWQSAIHYKKLWSFLSVPNRSPQRRFKPRIIFAVCDNHHQLGVNGDSVHQFVAERLVGRLAVIKRKSFVRAVIERGLSNTNARRLRKLPTGTSAAFHMRRFTETTTEDETTKPDPSPTRTAAAARPQSRNSRPMRWHSPPTAAGWSWRTTSGWLSRTWAQ